MKRILVALMLGLFVVSMGVGCGGGSATPSKATPK
jgi:hypothetical protein